MSNFCIHCGAQLEPDSAFCCACGAKVEDFEEADVKNNELTDKQVDQTTAKIEEFKETNSNQDKQQENATGENKNNTAPANVTNPINPVVPASKLNTVNQVNSGNASLSTTKAKQENNEKQANKKSNSSLKIVLPFVFVTAVAVGVAVGVLVAFHPWSPDPAQQEQVTVNVTPETQSEEDESKNEKENSEKNTSSNDSDSNKSSTSNNTTNTENTNNAQEASIRTSLENALRQCDNYNEEIVNTAVPTYDGNVYSKSSSSRVSARDKIKAIEDRILNSYNSLEKMNVPESSKYYGNFKDIKQLYNDLYHRIDVMYQGISRSCASNDIDKDIEYIDAPVVGDNNDQGINKYKIDYDNLRANVVIAD